MTPHLITIFALAAVVIGAGIYLESMRRHARATKIAERKRREAQERRVSADRRQVTDQRQVKRRHRAHHRSRERRG